MTLGSENDGLRSEIEIESSISIARPCGIGRVAEFTFRLFFFFRIRTVEIALTKITNINGIVGSLTTKGL